MAKVNIDMWYGDKVSDVDQITISFYPNGCEYRGNCLKDGRYIGDYSTTDSIELEKAFPQLIFNWD